LGANIWTTNDNALYSGALSISNITRVPKRPLVILAGTVGTVSAMWIYDNFVNWLVLLNAVLPPIGAILIIDYFLNRSRYRSDDTPLAKINIGAFVGVILGALAGWFINVGIGSINGMLVACFCYMVNWLIIRFVRKKK
jgi:cytosine permease